jgi:AcrR family transcriptional regulator
MSKGNSRSLERARRKLEEAELKTARKLEEAEQKTERKLDEAARQTARKLEDAGRRTKREFERAARELERAEERSGPIWARPEPGARRARFTREQIAEAALAVADAEGIDAVSMRRVATELGAGTMTLYHYVRTKDELVTLMDNAIMGELLIPEGEMTSNWREALTLIARRTRDAFERHPWTLGAMTDAQMGPNGMMHVEQSVQAVAGLDLDFVEKFEIISLVDEYVFGYAMRRRVPGPDDPGSRGEWLRQMTDYIEEELATGDYPGLAELLPEGGMAEAWERMHESEAADDRFERGLNRLLDGIELDLKRR